MSKLYYIQFLFIYILLFHFAANKDKFYIKYNEEKWEIDLYNNTRGGSSFYQLLKENSNAYTVGMTFNGDTDLEAKVPPSFNYNDESSVNPVQPGNIIAGLTDAGELFFVITLKNKDPLDYSEKIGQVIQLEKFINYFTNLNPQPNSMEIQFILEEVFEKPKNLNTLKNMERMTILERMVKKKPQSSWKNFGWKSLESFKSFLKLKKGKVLNLFNN